MRLIALILLLFGCALHWPALAQDELPPELEKEYEGKLPELPLPGMDMEEPEADSLALIPSLTLSREHFDEQLRYSGEERLEQWLGNIELEAGLGEVFFPGSLRLRGDLVSYEGTQVSVGGELRCGGNMQLAGGLSVDQALRVDGSLASEQAIRARAAISVGGDIDAAGGIATGGWLYSGGSIRSGGPLWCDGLLECRKDIECSRDATAMDGIRCGGAISCDASLTSGAGILAGGRVEVNGPIMLSSLLFCGTDPRAGREPDAVVSCSELIGGELAWGELELIEQEESAGED